MVDNLDSSSTPNVKHHFHVIAAVEAVATQYKLLSTQTTSAAIVNMVIEYEFNDRRSGYGKLCTRKYCAVVEDLNFAIRALEKCISLFLLTGKMNLTTVHMIVNVILIFQSCQLNF